MQADNKMIKKRE